MSDHRKTDRTTPSSTHARREIERKFLVTTFPGDINAWARQSLMQGYLLVTEDGTELRLRRAGDRFYQTLKTGRGLERMELEIELGQEQFDALWPATEGKRVVKDRYELEHGGLVIEVDVYHGALSGLITAEIEFDSREASGAFDPPDWVGTEVTDDDRYKNQSLAVHGAPRA